MTEGGSIIMPIDIVSVATIMSMTRNGNTKEPDLKAATELGNHEGGDKQPQIRFGSIRDVEAPFGQALEQSHILFSNLTEHEFPERLDDCGERVLLTDLIVHERLQAILPGAVEGRRHDKEGHEQGQADENEIGRRALQAEAGAQERERDDEPREACDHDEKARRD